MFQVYLIDDEIWALISLEKLIPWEEYGFCICGKSNSAKKPGMIFVGIRQM